MEIHMTTNPFLIGVDVASQKADIDVHGPQDQELGQFTMKVHNQQINQTLVAIKSIVAKTNTIVIMEATSIYHRIFYYAFLNSGFKVVLVNPYQSNAFQKATSLRKTVTDKISAHTLASIYRLKQFAIPKKAELNIELKKLVRGYYTLTDQQSSFKKRVKTMLAEIFPLFSKVFSDIFAKTPMTLLQYCPTPEAVLNHDKKSLFLFIKKTARKNASWAIHKLDHLITAATLSPSVDKGKTANLFLLNIYLDTIKNLETQIQSIQNEIETIAKKHQQIKLILSIPGIGPILAAAIIGEIDRFDSFKKPAQLFAFAGIDPSVKQSGKFKGSKNRMSKRGSKLLRRALYLAAFCAIRKNRKGQLNNPYLREYYDKKLNEGKPKKVALGACMNKMAGYIFATLRNNKPFVLINPQSYQWNKAS
jgi:transposase